MRKTLYIKFLALILCGAMVGELTVLVEGGDAISAEVDGEMEHEESKEKEKDKTTSGLETLLLEDDSIFSQRSLTIYQNLSWNSPPIDFQTPPPELS